MSILNPNVFFELGIRTALNKPVSLVRDNTTKKVPFDTGIINNHTYESSLATWTLNEEIESMTKHIKSSFKTGIDNALWKYFSMSVKAEPPKGKPEMEDKIDYLNLQMESLRTQIENMDYQNILPPRGGTEDINAYMIDSINFILRTIPGVTLQFNASAKIFYLKHKTEIPDVMIAEVKRYGFGIIFEIEDKL